MAVASALDSLVFRASARARVARGLVLASGAVVAVDGIVLVRALVGWPASLGALSAIALGAASAFFVGLAWPVSHTALAAALDHAGGLEGRIAAGLSFRRVQQDELRGFAAAAVRDAERRASLSLGSGLLAQAVPVRWPRSWPLAVLLTLGVSVLVSRRPVHHVPRVGVESPPKTTASVPTLDTHELETRSEAARLLLARTPEDERLRAQLAAYRALLESLADGTLAQEAALQRVLALEAALARQSLLPGQADGEATTRALRALADELRRAVPRLADALDEADAARAAETFHRLSQSMSQQPLAEREREQLRRALDQARAREKERAADEAREQELSVLQSRDAESGEKTVLKQREARQRELAELRRRAAARPKRTLEKLSRELGRAGAAMADEDRAAAADALDQAGSALDALDGELRDDAQARELARELSQLRESLQRRALGDPGQARDERTRREAAQRGSERSQRRAEPSSGAPAGEAPQRDEANGQSSPSPRSDDTETLALDSQDERRARRESFDQRARGERGESSDAGTQLRLGAPSGEAKATLVVPVESERSVVRRQVVEQTASAEHDEKQLPSPTSGRAKVEDRALSGVRGEGPTRNEVIRSAAQSGFASLPYRSVYGDYRAHAEAAIEADAIPAGYRFQVRRYFELVRPRQPQDPSR